MLSSTALVSLERPQRYGKQLAAHIAHRVQVDEIDGGWDLHIAGGHGYVLPHDELEQLELKAEAEDSASFERIKEVLAKHLLQFTTKIDTVVIEWEDR